MLRNVHLLQLCITAGILVMCNGCGNTKKDNNSQEPDTQNATAEVSMKPTASDEDPAWVYFTADSSGYPFTYRIKSNGTGLEKLYESKAEPIWISPDNRYVYITDQVTTSKEKDTFCPKGITIWNIEKKEKKVLPFYDEPTWGSGWFDNQNILYSKFYVLSKKGKCLFKQNILTGDTSIVFYWEKSTSVNALYNNGDNNFYYIFNDSLYVFKGKGRKYASYPVEYHFVQHNDGRVSLTKNGKGLFYYYFGKDMEWKYVLIDLQGKTEQVVDKSIDSECRISWVKIDKSGNWIYYKGYINISETLYSVIKRKNLNRNGKPEVIIITKSDEMSLGYIALGYDQ
jgi:hypothetical protein